MAKTTHRCIVVALLVSAAAVPTSASADDLSPPLDKAEATAMTVGKKVDYVRKRDGARQAWDFKDGGAVYFTTSTTIRNTSFSGTYTITDEGNVCFKWNPDKNLTLQDGCIQFRHDGGRLVVVVRGNPTTVYGDVLP